MPKLRPIIGHQQQVQQLLQDRETGNIAHAYLFSGAAHLGKMTVAHWFASEVLASHCSESEKQPVLRSIEKLTHPDLLVLDQLWIEKQCEDWDLIAQSSNVQQVHRSKKSAPAKTDAISIDDVRSLQERLHETSISTHRFCIIRGIERMQDAAANAFLKILEEPPEHLVFLLTTESLSSLLPTIVSRTRSLRFSRLPRKELQPILQGVNENDASFILRFAQGAPGLVYRLKDDPDTLRFERQIYEQASSFWTARSLKNRLHLLGPLHKRGEEADRFLKHLALSLRQQPPAQRELLMPPFVQLLRTLRTNTHRQLATQHFALSTAP